MHFRAFAIEPADRTAWGAGHVMTGLVHESRPDPVTERRNGWPLEWTVGLPAGFAMVLSSEAMAHAVRADASRSGARSREALLKYSLPERDGFHFAVMTGLARLGEIHTRSYGLSANQDTDIGTFGAGATWDRRHPGEAHGGREAGVNWFRLGQVWGVGAEWRTARTAEGDRLNHWLLGLARVVGHGVMADFAIGGTHGNTSARLVTAGLSWFY